MSSSVLRNIAWHSSEKVLRLFTGFFVGLWLARYLGPQSYGNFNYLLAWLGMFNAIAWLGVGETIMRDMVRDRSDEGRILGSALLIRLVGSFLAVTAALSFAHLVAGFDDNQMLLLALLCIGVPFAETPAGVWMWFASHTNIGPAVIGKNLSMLLGAALKVAVILTGAGLIALMSVVALESVLLALALFSAYRLYGQRFSHWRIDFRHAWQMLRDGLPIILSALVVSLNGKVDQLILGRIGGMTDVGIYAAAMRFSEIWWVVPPVIVQTLAARYIYPKELSPEKLRENVARIVAGMALLALLPCLMLSAVGPALIDLVLGAQYQGAGAVLLIHIWIAVLVFIDAPINQFLLATGRQRLLIGKSAILLAANFAGAIALVPRFGPTGAALATLGAQACAVILLPFLWRPIQDIPAIYAQAIARSPGLLVDGIGFLRRRLGGNRP